LALRRLLVRGSDSRARFVSSLVTMGIRPDRSTWRIEPRVVAMQGQLLKRFAFDITIRFSDGIFLEDHNCDDGVMHFDTPDELRTFLVEQIRLNESKFPG
jgi:hypothetical protein